MKAAILVKGYLSGPLFALCGLMVAVAASATPAQITSNPPDMNEGASTVTSASRRSHSAPVRLQLWQLTDCGQTLVMGQPMHIAVGSLAPQNGFAAGLAFVEHKNFSNEIRTTYDIDALATPNGSWRAGGYMKAYRQPGGFTYRPAPRLNLYAQSTSLKRVDYYGLGPNHLARPYHLRVQ